MLARVLKTMLRLLHPFMPFVTETIWSNLGEQKMLIGESWPEFDKSLVDEKVEKEMETVLGIVSEIRALRVDLNINAGVKLKTIIYGGAKINIIAENSEAIKRLVNLANIKISQKGPAIKSSLRIYLHGIEIYVPVEGILNIKNELQRIKKAFNENSGLLKAAQGKLSNKGFLGKAPEEIIEKEKANKERIETLLKKLTIYKKELENLNKP